MPSIVPHSQGADKKLAYVYFEDELVPVMNADDLRKWLAKVAGK
jgi:hypothetical protein